MIVFLYGSDDYRRARKKREVIAEFKKKRSDLGLRTFDLAAKEWRDDFDEFTRSGSLFEPAKLGVLENAFELEAKQLAKLLESFVADKTITLLLSERDKPVKALAFLLEKPVLAQKFENLEGAEWARFIADEAKALGVQLAPDASQFLATVYQGNSWALATELQKLGGLKANSSPNAAGNGEVSSRMITKKDLDTFDLEAAPNYWMLLNGLKSFDVRVRLSTLERLFAMNDAPAKIFNIVASQLKEKAALTAEFDFAIKSGKLEYEEALVELVLS